MTWYRGRMFLGGAILIAIANGAALGAVYFNRTGAPTSLLALSSRELEPPYSIWKETENSGLSLRFIWQVDGSASVCKSQPNQFWFDRGADWIDAARLKELGVKIRDRPSDRVTTRQTMDSLPAEVFLVLEMNGAAYARRVEAVCQGAVETKKEDAQRACEHQRDQASRLFVVDAGLDPVALREKHPDASMYAVVRGRINAEFQNAACDSSKVIGRIEALAVDSVEVPLSMRGKIDAALKDAEQGTTVGRIAPHRRMGALNADVAYGQLYEPWLAEVH